MKNYFSIFGIGMMLVASSCTKEKVATPTAGQGEAIDTTTDVTKLPAVQNYLNATGQSISKEVKITTNGNQKVYAYSLEGGVKEKALGDVIHIGTQLLVFSEQSGKIQAPFIVKEKLYYDTKIGYEMYSLLTPDSLEVSLSWTKNNNGNISPISSCNKDNGWSACVTGCLNAILSGEGGLPAQLLCILEPEICIGATVIACAMLRTDNPNLPIDQIGTLVDTEIRQGYLQFEEFQNGVYLVK